MILVFTVCSGLSVQIFRVSTWVKVFRIVPEFRILRLTFHRKSG